jgi:hypothetical protein
MGGFVTWTIEAGNEISPIHLIAAYGGGGRLLSTWTKTPSLACRFADKLPQ